MVEIDHGNGILTLRPPIQDARAARDRNSGIGTKLGCSKYGPEHGSACPYEILFNGKQLTLKFIKAGRHVFKEPEAAEKLKRKGQKAPDKPRIPSILSADLRISGDLKTDGDVQVDGIVDGDVESNLLSIGDSATVNGCVVGEIIRVAGTVNGETTVASLS